MIKFGIEVTKGNIETLIRTFDDHGEAMIFGNNYFAQMKKEDGILTCFSAEFDENNNKLSNVEKVYHVWF